MRANFDKHIRTILKNEGGYVNDPDDTGGETNFGISKRAYPKLNIKKLKLREAIEIYYKDYWVKSNCNELPEFIQLIHFDTAVNSGRNRANKILQKAIGDIAVDGVLGPITISRSSSITLADYAIERCLFYAKIVRNKKSQGKFIVGWVKRVKDIVKMRENE